MTCVAYASDVPVGFVRVRNGVSIDAFREPYERVSVDPPAAIPF